MSGRTEAASETLEPPAPRRAWLGRIVGDRYRLVRLLGAGGSGSVFEAEHLPLGKTFAVKVLRLGIQPGEREAARFRREARAMAKLRSEYVVSVIDAGALEDDTPFLVTELLEGEDLRSLLRREGALPVPRALHLALDACRGLVHVHAAGLVHRDLKPENLFVTRRADGEDWCKLLDFGVAKGEASQTTAQGAVVGTVRYMAPEQLADSARVSASTDIHALGLVLFECLAGKPARVGESTEELMYQVMNVTPVSLAETRPELPEELVALVQRCLAKSPAERPPSAAALLGELKALARAGAAPCDVTLAEFPPPRANRPDARQRALRSAALVALAAVTGYGVGRLSGSGQRASAGIPPQPAARLSSSAGVRATEPAKAAPPLEPAPMAPRVQTVEPPRGQAAASGIPPTAAVVPRRAPRPAPSADSSRAAGRFDRNNPYGD